MGKLWFNNAILYGLDIGSFKDGNNDGIGDFKGAIEKLDYLQDLGINCIWLLPFYESNDMDNGYDVNDYYSIDPRFGNFDDFMKFKEEAEKRDMRIIIDLVVHHTSDHHPWFKLASHNKNSKYYHYYIWNSAPPALPEENVFSGKTWKYSPMNNEYYYHKFYDFEPDLNIKNPEVKKEIKEIMRYWLDFGVAGFRLDAATHLFKPFKEEEGESPAEVMEDFHQFITSLKKDAFFLAEADVALSKIPEYVGNGRRMNMLFNFLLNNSLFLALAREKATPVKERLNEMPKFPENVHWANFIRNLDELDLEQLTEAERQEVFHALAPNPVMQAYGRGIRRRLAPMLLGNVNRMKMVYNLLFALPGIPVLVYGDEIGMGDNLMYEGRTAVRTPMQWDASANGGFSEASADKLKTKSVNEGMFSSHFVNVEEQEKRNDSLLNEIKKFIKVRKELLKMSIQNFDVIDLNNDRVLGLKFDNNFLIFINFSNEPVKLRIEEEIGNYSVILEDSSYGFEINGNELPIKNYGYRWFRKDD